MKKEINIQIGKRIKSRRKFMGYSREKLAELVGISSRFLSDIESGSVGMSFTTLESMCEVLCISSDYVLFGKEVSLDNNELVDILHNLDNKYIPLVHVLLMNFIETIATARQEKNKKN